MHVLGYLRRVSLLIIIDRYLWTASLLVSAAINDLLKLLLTILSNVGIWGLGVRGVLTPDYNAG